MLTTFLMILYIVICLALMLIILVQRGDSGGLGGAFGGAGGEQAFGAKADTSFKKVTVVLAALFLGLSVLLGYLESPARASQVGGEPTEQVEGSPEGGSETPPAESGGDETNQGGETGEGQ